MNEGDIIEIVSRGSVTGSAVLNVYQMRVLAIDPEGDPNPFRPAIMEDLLVMNYELLIEDLIPWCPTSVRWHGIDVRNLFNVNEVNSSDYASDYVGTNVGEGVANFVSPRITSTRKIYGMHGGRKSLPPVSEAVVNSNSIAGGLVTSLATMVAKWNAPSYLLEDGATFIDLQPVVVKRVREGAGTDADPYTYRMPETQAEAVYYVADNWKVESLLGSAGSRKVGHGS